MKKLLMPALLATVLLRTVHGQILVANFANGTVGECTTSGTTLNASFISGLSEPMGIAISGNYLFISEQGKNRIAEYTTSRKLVNASMMYVLYRQSVVTST